MAGTDADEAAVDLYDAVLDRDRDRAIRLIRIVLEEVRRIEQDRVVSALSANQVVNRYHCATCGDLADVPVETWFDSGTTLECSSCHGLTVIDLRPVFKPS